MIFLFILFCFGLAGGIVGKLKGSLFALWFAVSFVVPVGGLLAALLFRWERDEPRRECPGCGRLVLCSDALCTRCGTELDFSDERVAIGVERSGRSAA